MCGFALFLLCAGSKIAKSALECGDNGSRFFRSISFASPVVRWAFVLQKKHKTQDKRPCSPAQPQKVGRRTVY